MKGNSIKDIFGNIKDLKPNCLSILKQLQKSHVLTDEILDLNLIRKLNSAVQASHRMVGVLLNRKGEVVWTIVGDANRLYLPDIGRNRASKDRLRGLRLIVATPTPLNFYKDKQLYVMRKDFITDLEKLRLDAVVEIEAIKVNAEGPIIIANLATTRKDNKNVIEAIQKNYKNIFAIKEDFSDFISSILLDIKQIENNIVGTKYLDKAFLIGAYTATKREGYRSMEELKELARSASVFVADYKIQWKKHIDPKTVIGRNTLEEICLEALSQNIEIIIFDRELTPSQLMHITDMTDLKILDRPMLILDIFAQRAVTQEGKIQVEVAQLNYSLPRIAKKQTGLSRLTGGIGGRGPGETKLEVNKRIVKDKLARLEKNLEKIKEQRNLRRKNRQLNQLPTLAIVGYTNAGKSTLLNKLCGANIYAKDELFATLDPHSRRLRFPTEQEVIITDTVGFIHNLPKALFKAFKATLEELEYADLLLHVVDASDDNYIKNMEVVDSVLQELNIIDKPKILIFNKIDNINTEQIEILLSKYPDSLSISATQHIGLKELIESCSKKINNNEYLSGYKAEEVFFDERED